MKSFCLVLLSFLTLVSCQTKPTTPPEASVFKNSFYSLLQSGISEYSCQFIPTTIEELSDSEIDSIFKYQFHRLASLQEKGMLKGLRWKVVNSNGRQEAQPKSKIRDFPTTESADIAERLTYFISLINKILTLTYLENFADRPDLKSVIIADKQYKVISNLNDVAAEVDFNQKNYRIFYGEKADTIFVSMQPLGSMLIPNKITLGSNQLMGKKLELQMTPEKIDLVFELQDGIPKIRSFRATARQFPDYPIRFRVEDCKFIK
jgi:hypothetical protein